MERWREELYADTLYHHGIKGQKWGVRRFQDKNGKLTQAGKSRYYNYKSEQLADKVETSKTRLGKNINNFRSARNKAKSVRADLRSKTDDKLKRLSIRFGPGYQYSWDVANIDRYARKAKYVKMPWNKTEYAAKSFNSKQFAKKDKKIYEANTWEEYQARKWDRYMNTPVKTMTGRLTTTQELRIQRAIENMQQPARVVVNQTYYQGNNNSTDNFRRIVRSGNN